MTPLEDALWMVDVAVCAVLKRDRHAYLACFDGLPPGARNALGEATLHVLYDEEHYYLFGGADRVTPWDFTVQPRPYYQTQKHEYQRQRAPRPDASRADVVAWLRGLIRSTARETVAMTAIDATTAGPFANAAHKYALSTAGRIGWPASWATEAADAEMRAAQDAWTALYMKLVQRLKSLAWQRAPGAVMIRAGQDMTDDAGFFVFDDYLIGLAKQCAAATMQKGRRRASRRD